MATFSSELLSQAHFFHQFSFLHREPAVPGEAFLQALHDDCARGMVTCLTNEHGDAAIYYRHLPWDSDYFSLPNFRIDFFKSSLPQAAAIVQFESLLNQLATQLVSAHGKSYLFAEIPAQALAPMQALCLARWRMVETRLTYFHDGVAQFSHPQRFPVRSATVEDVPNLRQVAAQARNDFDRYHADAFYSLSDADDYLSTFAENSVRGFADVTLVPDEGALDADAFLTGNILSDPALQGRTLGKMPLSVVGEQRRGWNVKLVSELCYWFKERGVAIAQLTTQATNKAAIRTLEKLDFSYGRCTHVFVMALDPDSVQRP